MSAPPKPENYWPNSYFQVRDWPMLRATRDGQMPSACQILDKYLAHATYGNNPESAKYGWVNPNNSPSGFPDSTWLTIETNLERKTIERARASLVKVGWVNKKGYAISVMPVLEWYEEWSRHRAE